MTKTSNFIISLLTFSMVAFLLSGFTAGSKAEALSIDPDYFYREACPILSTKDLRTYGPGAKGQFVSALQKFLSVDGSYRYGMGPMSWAEFTGYYGPVTTAAVKDWQAKNGVVSSGSVYTTGYGYVGPKTRKAIAQRCAEKLSTVEPVIPPSPYWGEITATHTFDERSDQHVISGKVQVPNPCYGVEVKNVTVRESLPELVTIDLSVYALNTFAECIQVVSEKPFSVEFEANEKVRIDFNINGQDAKVDLKGGESSHLEIDSLKGPEYLFDGQVGTWEMNLSGYAGSGVRYNVNWGEPLKYDYMSDDDNTAEEPYRKTKKATFNHSYDEPGTYRIQFRVTDSAGNKALKTYEITVHENMNMRPYTSLIEFGK